MTWMDLPLLLALVIDLALGLLIFFTNPTRSANRLFLLVCLFIATWMTSVLFGLNATEVDAATFWVRCACASSCFIPLVFHLLRLSILHSHPSVLEVIRRGAMPLLIAVVVAGVCYTPLFIQATGSHFPPPDALGRSVLEPAYGPGFALFGGYYVSFLLFLVWAFARNIRKSTGLVRVEFQFIALGSAAMMTGGVTAAIIVPALIGSSATAPYAPLSVLLLIGFVAYGIAAHRIMEVSNVLRRLSAYGLLAAYLAGLYALVFISVDRVIELYGLPARQFTAPLLATLLTAFAVAPANTRFQDVARRLFVNIHALDFSETVQRANRLLASIRTLPELTRQFSSLLGKAFGTDRVFLYLMAKDRLELRHALGSPPPPPHLSATDPVVELAATDHDPIVRDLLTRLVPTVALRASVRQLTGWEASVAVGIYSHDQLAGLLLLGPRLSGRIYGVEEQIALRTLCDQFAVAQENAQLYTEVQDAKNYNEKLLDNLVSGVVAVDADHRVTVFNREAQRITKLNADALIGREPTALPEPLRPMIGMAFAEGEMPREREISWPLDATSDAGERMTVRVGGTRLTDRAGQPTGALLVFHDISSLKRLEQQIRRTDRLASLGTLSAGMAHEIKNPLVTLKTFVQLLPERYEDPEFRTTFASLLGDEVMRIDRLVNQLLRFARPTKPTLAPLNLHQVADHVLKLVSEQARQKHIACVSDLRSAQDAILGDHDLLVQALLNFLFNAIEAMGEKGTLTVSSALVEQETPQMGLWGQATTETYIRLTVLDTGPGIRPEDLPHVFDPFFTTKSSGTGLGLSVAHGIIHEHHGLVDAESELGKGTAFHLLFPLATREAPA